MSSAARSRATTTPIARTTRSPGITGTSTSAARGFSNSPGASSEYRKQHPNFHRYAFYDNDPEASHPDKNIVWFRADGKRMGAKDWENGGWMRTLGMFLNGTAPEIRDSAGDCAEDKDFLLLLNAHHEPVAFRISYELYHSGWKIAFDTARPELADRGGVGEAQPAGGPQRRARSLCSAMSDEWVGSYRLQLHAGFTLRDCGADSSVSRGSSA